MTMTLTSSPHSLLPKHIAIIMDGNGRWAQQRGLPRIAGHHAGVKSVRSVVRSCGEKGIEALTLFAFSSENWRRPEEEVSHLMKLFLTMLQLEVKKLHKNNVQLRFIGNMAHFNKELIEWMEKAKELTAKNTGLKLVIAIDYGGRWDITEAAKKLAYQAQQGIISPAEINTDSFSAYLSSADLPEPDLFIRTGGEQRISNFLLWQLAYTELYFTQKYWPDFDKTALEEAIMAFTQRTRRFGGITETSHA